MQAVFGVVGGIGFTKAMLDNARSLGLLTVVPTENMYEVAPLEGGLRNFKATATGDAQPASAVGGDGQSTEAITITEAELQKAVDELDVVDD